MQRSSPSTTARRVSRASIALVVALTLIIPSAASAAAFSAKVHFPNHNPIAGKNWVITWTATKGRTKLSGSDSYQFFSGRSTSGSPVAHRARRLVQEREGPRHVGRSRPMAVGHQLTLVVVIKTSAGTVKVPWLLTTKK